MRKGRVSRLNKWAGLPPAVQLHIAFLLFQHTTWPRWRQAIFPLLLRVDLWLFPLAAFYGGLMAMRRITPSHPIADLVILTTASMAATGSIFLLHRPRHYKAHWIRRYQ